MPNIEKILATTEKNRLEEVQGKYIPIGHDTDPKERMNTGVKKRRFRGWTINWSDEEKDKE